MRRWQALALARHDVPERWSPFEAEEAVNKEDQAVNKQEQDEIAGTLAKLSGDRENRPSRAEYQPPAVAARPLMAARAKRVDTLARGLGRRRQ
jgi:hypothetical protein